MNYYVECTWCDGFDPMTNCAHCSGSGYRPFGSVPEDDVFDYEAARVPFRRFLGFIYSGGSVHPQTFERILLGAMEEIIRAGLGIGDNDERQPVDVPGLPPVEKCPYCDQCRPMGLPGCLGHYPPGAGIGGDDAT